MNGFPPERRGTLNGIEKATFQGMEVEDKLNVLFDYHVSMHNLVYRLLSEQCPKQHNDCGERMEKAEGRIDKIEHQRWMNITASSFGGIIGGFVAMVSKWLFLDKA